MQPPWDGETKVCSKVLVTWPRWPPCSYIIKPLKKLFLRNQKADNLELRMQHWVLEDYQVCSNDDPGLTLTYFTARSNSVPYAFVWEKGKTMDFSETIVVYDFKLATDDQWHEISVDIKILSPRGCMPPAPGLYICIKSWRKLYELRLQRDFFKMCNKWVKW